MMKTLVLYFADFLLQACSADELSAQRRALQNGRCTGARNDAITEPLLKRLQAMETDFRISAVAAARKNVLALGRDRGPLSPSDYDTVISLLDATSAVYLARKADAAQAAARTDKANTLRKAD